MGYSFSKLDLADKCMFAYNERHNKNTPEPIGEGLVVGNAMHELVAQYLRHLYGAKQKTNLDFLKKLTDEHLCFLPPECHDSLVECMDSFGGFFMAEERDAMEVEMPLAVNRKWSRVDWFSKYAFFRAKIDYFYLDSGVGVIIDWKSNRQVPPQTAIQASFQIRVYAWLISLLYPEIEEFLIRLHYVRYNIVRQELIHRWSLEKTPDVILEKIKRIEEEKDFKPTPGSHCNMCGYVPICPVYVKALVPLDKQIGPVVRHEDAIKLATILKMIKIGEKRIEQVLREYVDKHRPVIVGDECLNFTPTSSLVFDNPEKIEAAVNLLGKEGVPRENIWRALSMSKSSLSKALGKKRQKLVDKALELATEKQGTEFKFSKVKED